MANNGSMEIAGKRTAADWNELNVKLAETPSLWDTAFEDFFMARLNTRYLEPIRLLQQHGNNEGEGFSIVSLQCALIEFLQTTRDGANYNHSSGKYKPEEQQYEYGSSSQEIFTKFLTNQEPFKSQFDESSAKGFFKYVRCSLLHEARTTGVWRITARKDRQETIAVEDGIAYLQRDLFQRDLEAYIWKYKVELLSDDLMKEAFIRKFNALCDLPIVDEETDTE